MDEVTQIDPSNPLWMGMIFLAALCYPGSHHKRDRAISAMKSWAGRLMRDAGRDAPERSGLINLMASRDMESELRRMQRLLVRRFEMLQAFERVVFYEHPYSQGKHWSLNQSLGVYKRGSVQLRVGPIVLLLKGEAQPIRGGLGKLKSGIWKESLPVMHLAAGLRGALLKNQITNMTVTKLLLVSGKWVESAFQSAEINLAGFSSVATRHRSLAGYRSSKKIRLLLSQVPE